MTSSICSPAPVAAGARLHTVVARSGLNCCSCTRIASASAGATRSRPPQLLLSDHICYSCCSTRLRSPPLVLPDRVRLSWYSPIASVSAQWCSSIASASAGTHRLRPSQLVLLDRIRYSCCSTRRVCFSCCPQITSTSPAASRLCPWKP